MATRSRNRRSLLLSLLLALVLHPVGAALVLLLWPGESQQLDEGRSSLDDVHVVEVVAMHRPAASVRVEPERQRS